MPLLARPLSIRDVRDVEKLARQALFDHLRAAPGTVRPQDHDDCVCFLIELTWELDAGFDEEREAVSFSTYSYRRARLRIYDFIRSTYGRTKWKWSDGTSYERKRPHVTSLDAPVSANDGDSLGELVAGSGGDPATDRDSELLAWAKASGSGEAARDSGLIHSLVDREIARRTRERSEVVRQLIALGLTKEDIAAHVGVALGTVHAWAVGRMAPKPRYREALELLLAELDSPAAA